ncbi:uncharacterized protein LOC124647688 [Lolium rigidum]|uniref:uncharacterized protein LOC124647688 n=1 Tax=Lolium rigidum TaxID=89674 RepID=UPI001F5E046F|nr:uncharacterized protein LOC124647688 [Lolium rigidum]
MPPNLPSPPFTRAVARVAQQPHSVRYTPLHPESQSSQPLVAGGMLTYPGDPRGNPPQHGALSSLSTSAAPFTVAGPHPAGPTFPNPSFAVPAAPSLNAAAEWGDPSLMEARASFMAPGAAAAASLGHTGEVFDSAPYGIYSEYHFGNFVDTHPLRSENSELISEKRPGTCGETSEALSNGFGLSSRCQEHSHCHPDAERNMFQMSDSSSRNRAIFLELMHNLSAVLVSTCNDGSSLHEYEKENLKSIIRNLKAVSSKGGKATLKGDDCLRNSSQLSCLRNNFSVAIPEHSVSTNTDSEFNAYFSQAFPKLPEDKMLDDSEVSQVSIYKKLWIEAEALVCKLKYELQVTRMKLAANKGHNTETEGAKAPGLPVCGGKPYSHAEASSGPAPLPPPILSPRSIIATKRAS